MSAIQLAQATTCADLEAATVQSKGALNSGLTIFQLKPPSLKSEELLDHMHKFAKVSNTTTQGKKLLPSPYLDLSIGSPQRELILNLTKDNIKKQTIIQIAGGTKASKKMAKMMIGFLGTVQNECSMLKDEKALKKLENRVRLWESMDEIEVLNKAEEMRKRAREIKESKRELPAAREKLAQALHMSKEELVASRTITKSVLVSVLVHNYGRDLKEVTGKKMKKSTLVDLYLTLVNK